MPLSELNNNISFARLTHTRRVVSISVLSLLFQSPILALTVQATTTGVRSMENRRYCEFLEDKIHGISSCGSSDPWFARCDCPPLSSVLVDMDTSIGFIGVLLSRNFETTVVPSTPTTNGLQ